MDNSTRVQIPDEAVRISHTACTLEKRMNPTILSPAMGKILEPTGLFSLGMTTSHVEGKLWIQIPYKNWPCVTSCSCGGIGKYIELNGFKYSHLTSIILLGNNHLFARSYMIWSSFIQYEQFSNRIIWLIDETRTVRPEVRVDLGVIAMIAYSTILRRQELESQHPVYFPFEVGSRSKRVRSQVTL